MSQPNNGKKLEQQIIKLTRNILPIKQNEHPLCYTWTFWYLKIEKNFCWENSQLDLVTFSTIESFWSVVDWWLKPLTDTHVGCNYSLFKQHIRPVWEDPMNRNGGRFIFTIHKKQQSGGQHWKSMAEHIWLELMMMMIGNYHPEYVDHICGLVGGNRITLIKIAVWIKDGRQINLIKQLGKYLKNITSIPETETILYESHGNFEQQQQQQTEMATNSSEKIQLKI